MKTLWILSITLNFYSHVMTVTIYPSDYFVAVPDGGAVFTCLSISEDVLEIQWFLNGTVFEESPNIAIVFAEGVGSLQFTNIPTDYNNTVIRCQAELQSGSTELSHATLLLIQGILSAVTSLETTELDSMISISWVPPVFLNIDGIDSNLISYCVEIVDQTSAETLLDQCGIAVTEFTYPTPADDVCHALRVTVTPVNAVGNGERQQLVHYSPSSPPKVMEVGRSNGTEGIIYSLIMSIPVCSAELFLEDRNDTKNVVTLEDSDLGVTGNILTFMADQVKANRLYNFTYEVNAEGPDVSNITLSTHDLESFIAMETANNTIKFKLKFFNLSDAMGAMVGFLFKEIDGTINLNRSKFMPFDRRAIHSLSLDSGSYAVHAYDIEHSGVLDAGIGYPAFTSDIVIDGDSEDVQSGEPCIKDIEACRIDHFHSSITVNCSFSSSSLNSFQILAQLTEGDDVCRLIVSQNMDLQTAATIEVDSDREYRITVLPIRSDSGIMLDSCQYTIFSEGTQASQQRTTQSGTAQPGTFQQPRTLQPGTQAVAIAMWTLLVLGIVILLFTIAGVCCAYLYKRHKKGGHKKGGHKKGGHKKGGHKKGGHKKGGHKKGGHKREGCDHSMPAISMHRPVNGNWYSSQDADEEEPEHCATNATDDVECEICTDASVSCFSPQRQEESAYTPTNKLKPETVAVFYKPPVTPSRFEGYTSHKTSLQRNIVADRPDVTPFENQPLPNFNDYCGIPGDCYPMEDELV